LTIAKVEECVLVIFYLFPSGWTKSLQKKQIVLSNERFTVKQINAIASFLICHFFEKTFQLWW